MRSVDYCLQQVDLVDRCALVGAAQHQANILQYMAIWPTFRRL